eukprot:15364437-Ditylum_brightwellii.AAC.1
MRYRVKTRLNVLREIQSYPWTYQCFQDRDDSVEEGDGSDNDNTNDDEAEEGYDVDDNTNDEEELEGGGSDDVDNNNDENEEDYDGNGDNSNDDGVVIGAHEIEATDEEE